ncbi:hypothetical protein ACROYT_G001267 [Oculina patagonica]
MKVKIWNLFEKELLVPCGDGQMDSLGFSAKYCLYTMMDHFLDLFVNVEVVDKREVGGTSSLMEKMGCKRILERMVGILNLQELVTDASSVIMKMLTNSAPSPELQFRFDDSGPGSSSNTTKWKTVFTSG